MFFFNSFGFVEEGLKSRLPPLSQGRFLVKANHLLYKVTISLSG